MTRSTRNRSFRIGPLRAGEWVEVRSAREIEATLDADGCLDGLPFMAEMGPYCGTPQRVFRRVDKIIDVIEHTGLRRMTGAVTLEGLRCGGGAHGGCQSGCQFLWKQAWLRRGSPRNSGARSPEPRERPLQVREPRDLERFEAALVPKGRRAGGEPVGGDYYSCQATELFRASSVLSAWDPRQYLLPLISGNVSLGRFLRVVAIDLFNAAQRLHGGIQYPSLQGIRSGKTPTERLGVRPGDRVTVKSRNEIVGTLDSRNRNRVLWFGREMLSFCGGSFKVSSVVDTLIEERTGRLVKLKNPCVILDGVTATGERCRFNPQSDYILWSEV